MTHKEGNKPFVSLHSVLGKPFILDQYVIPVVLKIAPPRNTDARVPPEMSQLNTHLTVGVYNKTRLINLLCFLVFFPSWIWRLLN